MAVRIQFRRGTAAEWTSANPTLAAGELGYETDTTKFKLGDGSTAWTSLGYGGVSQSDIDNAVANVIDLAPDALNTLNELAASIGDDADYANTVLSNIANAESNAISHANGVASSAQTNAQSYTDTAINNLIDSAPGTLNTLNELANALGDDANFSTTVTNSLANRITFETDTAANFASANAILDAQTFGITSDTRRVKVGDGVQNWGDLTWLGEDLVLEHNQDTSVHGISNTANLVYQADLSSYAELESATLANTTFTGDISLPATTTLGGITATEFGYLANVSSDVQAQFDDIPNTYATAANTILTGTVTLPSTTSIGDVSDTEIGYLDGVTSAIQTQIDAKAPTSDPTFTGTVTLPTDTSIGNVSSTELGYVDGVTSPIQTQIDTLTSDSANTYAPIANAVFSGTISLPTETSIGNVSSSELEYLDGVTSAIQTQIDAKAPTSDPTFTGTVTLPTDTSIGDVSSTEISYLNNVSSAIQTQLDGKLGTSTASTTYAPLANATLTGTVSLPANTSIGDVSATEIGYLNNVSSAIQTQLDAKAPTASPTFTGTVSGVTASMVGLGNVDNTSDANKPVSTATQTALDAKLSLAGGTMIGKITLDGDPSQALHAVTKQYADSISEGLHIHSAVVAATTGNIDLTGGTFGGTMDGVTLSDGDRVLVKNQTDATENGIYVYTASGSTFARATDFDEPAEVSGGDFVFVLGGTLYDNTGWVQVTESVTTIGTDNINFTQFSGAGSITAGNNISVSGTTISLVDTPTLTDKLTVSSNGIQFSDNTVQTSAGVPSITGFTEKTASYTLDTLDHQDNVVEMNSGSALTFTIPTNSALAWPVGASMDIIQTGAGQVTISPDTGVTLNYTPGNKLRTQWSSCTIMKRASDSWIVYGDLTA